MFSFKNKHISLIQNIRLYETNVGYGTFFLFHQVATENREMRYLYFVRDI